MGEYNRLTVLDTYYLKGRLFANCLCDCGSLTKTRFDAIKNEHTKSCGCLYNEKYQKQLLGQKFGRLIPIQRLHTDDYRIKWLCKCDCGQIKICSTFYLTKKWDQSCGCWLLEKKKNRFKTHGLSNHKLFTIWRGIIDRCYYPKTFSYKYYGGRGIKICEIWKKDFKAFYDWAINNGWQEGLSIDRINNNGNYCPENCRFVTAREQANNRRGSVLVTIYGETLTLMEAVRLYSKVEYATARKRIKNGWTLQKALLTPAMH